MTYQHQLETLLEVTKGALGYLEALPVPYRPDEAWFKPLRSAILWTDWLIEKDGINYIDKGKA